MPITAVRNTPALKNHLLHILDTTQLLLNLENCTLSLTNADGSDSLSVQSSAVPASIALRNFIATRDFSKGDDYAMQLRQRLELDLGEIANTARTHLTQSPLPGADCGNARDAIQNEKEHKSGSFIELHLVRSAPFGRLSDTEKNAVQRALDSINRAIVTYVDERTNDYYASTLERLLAHLCIGLIRLSHNLDVFEKSSLVDSLLTSTSSYRVVSNRLVKIAGAQPDPVERAIHSLDRDNLPYAIVDVVSTSNEGQCALVVTRLTASGEAIPDGYLIYVLCSVADHFEASDLLNFWHITPAEKRALAALTRFGNIKKVAIELGVSPNTVKTQLKSAYKKLGVDNKISLLRRFSLLRLIESLTGHQ